MHLPRLLPIIPVLLLAAGCRQDDEIKTYRVAKESVPVAEVTDSHATSDPHAGMGPATGENPHSGMTMDSPEPGPPSVLGEVPDHWTAGATSSMRLAGYSVKSEDGQVADVSLASLGGMAGGTLDNINRWRGQIMLPPVDDVAEAGEIAEVTNPLGKVMIVDLDAGDGAAEGDGRIVAGILPLGQETWFFKMRGDRGLVGREKSAFLRWIETAKPVEP